MDFKLVTEKILNEFKRINVRYALIGGFALGVWGVNRATVDIDFLINRNDYHKVHSIMNEMGYKCIYQTENVSQYKSSVDIFGEIDFLHAFRESSLGMLQRAIEKEVFDKKLTIRVLKPEDLIGLKVQAIANDESRKSIDITDIELLIALYWKDLDWSMIEEYFALFGFEEIAKELRKKYCGA